MKYILLFSVFVILTATGFAQSGTPAGIGTNNSVDYGTIVTVPNETRILIGG